ncbi:hypothetical protein MTQ89_07125 [Staphylococcus hyicus]|nr:hypothetical protein [Staphylococcus hyicus]MCO4329566.1 hypothetical protein [Staphylococcus hyicus]MCO4336521.1 hypothetical protein [Staphylococcus hyicus]
MKQLKLYFERVLKSIYMNQIGICLTSLNTKIHDIDAMIRYLQQKKHN